MTSFTYTVIDASGIDRVDGNAVSEAQAFDEAALFLAELLRDQVRGKTFGGRLAIEARSAEGKLVCLATVKVEQTNLHAEGVQ